MAPSTTSDIGLPRLLADRKSTRLNSSHLVISYAVFCLKKKHAVAVLPSNRTQLERIEALEGFKSGKYEVMVATAINSRGLDIAGVSDVTNYAVPDLYAY